MIINIIGGTGKMGSVFSPVFQAAGHQVILSGRKTTPNLEDACQQSDLSIFSVPIDVTEEYIHRYAPFCRGAMMDFTGKKEFPVRAMLRSALEGCEVAGLHPMYGQVQSISGRPVVYCKTARTGERCEQVVSALKKAGADIIEMNPLEHDRYVEVSQDLRLDIVEAFMRTAQERDLDLELLYKMSPPPTRILMNLAARQVDPENDEMYLHMRERGGKETLSMFFALLCRLTENRSTGTPKRIREYFAGKLKEAQAEAARLINLK